MEDKTSVFSLGETGQKHLSCKRLRDKLDEEMGEDIEAIAATKRELSANNVTSAVLAQIKKINRYSVIFSIVASITSAICLCIFASIFSYEWEQEKTVYPATILGVILVVVAFSFMVANAATPNFYEKSHLTIMLWCVPIIITALFAYSAYIVSMFFVEEFNASYLSLAIFLVIVIIFMIVAEVYLLRVRDLFKTVPDHLRESTIRIIKM